LNCPLPLGISKTEQLELALPWHWSAAWVPSHPMPGQRRPTANHAWEHGRLHEQMHGL
jgi:hypothetical protein